MDTNNMGDDKDLDLEAGLVDFLTEWHKEIEQGKDSKATLGKHEREDSSTSPFKPSSKRSLSSDSREAPPKHPLSDINDPPPLLVLPARASCRTEAVTTESASSTAVQSGDRLVDRLIADLDEINTIPFFDVDLPKEIATIIFGYLDVGDLCRCALVSRSWRVLAEDNLLWYQLYLKIVPDSDYDPQAPLNWKCVVRDELQRRRLVDRNWKERICGLSDHQPDDCRVLCCLCYFEGTVLSCYSSGAVCVWDLSAETGPVRVKQTPGPFLHSEPTCCDLQSNWAALGTSDGCLKIVDTETCSEAYNLSDLGTVDSISVASSSAGQLVVGVASHNSTHVGVHPSLSVLEAVEDKVWSRKHVPLAETTTQLTRVQVVNCSPSPCCLLYSSFTSLTLHPLHSTPTHILSALGDRGGATCISCFEVDRDMTTLACGTSALGYQVQLFDLPSGASRLSLKGHGQPVTALSLCPSPTHMLASGSADKRVRVFDCRCQNLYPVLTLRGHNGIVKCVQMDQWKVISGSSDGTLIVWDQRMAGELWRTHERHPVEYCSFDGHYLVCGHVPLNKHPIRNVAGGENPNICHRRLRGLVRVMDFSVDPLYYTKKLPSICSSNYDEPSASSFNLDLKLPYDTIPS